MANEWRTGKLGELVAFKTGKLDSNAAVPDGDYPFFTCSQETLRTNTFSFETEIQVPPLPVQRRIAGILSAYDELTENSQRRIRLLEAMARALYREWFVHFRFPGHEKSSSPAGRGGGEGRARLVTSPLGDIPQRWEVCALGDFVQFKSGFAFKSGTFTADGEHRLVTIRNV
jgi:type I restriction enzyme, S subunit